MKVKNPTLSKRNSKKKNKVSKEKNLLYFPPYTHSYETQSFPRKNTPFPTIINIEMAFSFAMLFP